MAHARTSRFPSRGGSNRRKTSWSAGPSQVNLPSITADGAFLWATGSQVLNDGLTMVRVRGSLGVWLEVVNAIGDGFNQVAFGICNVSENAFGIGVTAVPSPLSDVGWDGWLWHKILSPVLGFSVTEGENTGTISQLRVDIDSKAMRKLKATDVTIGVGQFLSETGTATLQFLAETRILDKLA